MTDSATNIRPLRAANAVDDVYREFSATIERAAVYSCATSPRFWARVGVHLRPECLQDPRGAPLLRACAAIARETGEGPSKISVALQRIQREVDDGKAKASDLRAAAEYLYHVEDVDGGVPKIDELVAVIAPTLQQRVKADIVRRIIEDHGKQRSLARYGQDLQAVERIGLDAAVGSTRLSVGVWEGIDLLRRSDRLPLGILPLDAELGGGVYPSSLTVIGADTNVGKTALLVHTACYAFLAGKRVVFVPTEESVSSTMIRVVSWLTGVLTSRVERSDPEAKAKLARVLAASGVGALAVEYLPQGSTIADLRRLLDGVQSTQSEFSDGWDVLIVDYADKLSGRGEKTYDQCRDVYDQLRGIAVEARKWVLTASQLKYSEQRKRRPTAQDLSDSQWKGRIADTVITVTTPAEEPHLRDYLIAKNRGPGAGVVVPNVPTELDRARMAPLPAEVLLEDDF